MPTVTADLINLFVESDALRLAELVRQKEVTPAELTETAIRLIENLDPKLNAVVIRDFERARERAARERPQMVLSAAFPIFSRISGPVAKGCP